MSLKQTIAIAKYFPLIPEWFVACSHVHMRSSCHLPSLPVIFLCLAPRSSHHPVGEPDFPATSKKVRLRECFLLSALHYSPLIFHGPLPFTGPDGDFPPFCFNDYCVDMTQRNVLPFSARRWVFVLLQKLSCHHFLFESVFIEVTSPRDFSTSPMAKMA